MNFYQRASEFATRLIDQEKARVIIEPQRPGSGHWFGGGNMIEVGTDLWIVGRFRNAGDSRTGLGAGERGLELALFRSSDRGQTFSKEIALSKQDLSLSDREVLSIEGSAVRQTEGRFELFVSTEKKGIEYPPGLESFKKPNTGVWTIDRLTSDSIDGLSTARVEPVVECHDPQFVHVKDPFLGVGDFKDVLFFCTHPFGWSSSNTAYVKLDKQGMPVGDACFEYFQRGYTWDVAMTRGTAWLSLPKPANGTLLFYDGGECLRDLDEHSNAVRRPRGYSCEEIGGLAYCDNGYGSPKRISITEPLFISPNGTGCSRYVDVLETVDGYYATWQQGQSDGAQPLVMNFVSREEAESIFRG